MRKVNIFPLKFKTLLVLLFGLLAPPAATMAQTLLNDSFNYSAGNLYGQGEWVRHSPRDTNPLQIIDDNLTYTGYENEEKGKSARISDAISSESLFKIFREPENAIKSGAIYYSALIKVESAKEKANYIMTFLQKGWSDLADGKSGTELGRLFIQKGSSENKFKFGVDRAGTKPSMTTEEFDLNTVYLVIVRYQINGNEGTNDVVSLFINPEDITVEPATPDAQTTDQSGSNVTRGIMALELRQGGTNNNPAPSAIVDAVRVTTDYAELFKDKEVPVGQPEIIPTLKQVECGDLLTGLTYIAGQTITGKNLKGDITVTGITNSDIKVGQTTISKEDAKKGYDLPITLTPSASGTHSGNITLESPGAEPQTITLTWIATEAPKISDLATLATKTTEEGTTFNFTGNATVTYVDSKDGVTNIYMQDETGGIRLFDEFGDIMEIPEKGDVLTNMFVTVTSSLGAPYIQIMYGTTPTVVEKDKDVTPVTVTLNELKINAKKYLNTVVRIENVTFLDNVGENFTESMTNPRINDGTAEGRMNIFDGTDIIGTPVPSEAITMTGISTSTGAAIVAPRSLVDMGGEEPAEPGWNFSETKFNMARANLNTRVTLGKLNIETINLPEKVKVSFSGKNQAYFYTSEWEIAPNGKTDVEIYYEPEAVGKHEAYISFMVGEGEEFYQRIRLEGVCIDPDNPPTVTVEPAEIPEFASKVGSTAEYTIKVTSAHLPDYLSAKIEGSSKGAFQLNTTLLPKDGVSNLKITFKPVETGTFEDRIILSSLEVDIIYVNLKGKASSGDEEEKEGDELPLVTDNPLVLLQEGFDGQTHNKPLKMNGWKNIAMKGNRAWWAYSFKDNEGKVTENTAKVTAYKGNVPDTYSEPCEMLLVTPPLDFKNAKSKIFTFRVMGDLLREDQADLLELCYIDMMEDEMYIAPIELEMPNIPDLNNEWQEYHIDLDGQNIADVFFMGFRFKSTLGKESSAIYYIDDVSFGRTDLPQIKPSQTTLAFEAKINKDYVSKEIEVTGINLQEDIQIKIGGPNKSKFDVTASTVSKEGGKFAVKFKSDQLGVHEAYVKLSSRGAADIYIPLSANCKETVGIEDIDFSTISNIEVYSINGYKVLELDSINNKEDILNDLDNGYYIIRYTKDGKANTVKVIKEK